MILSRIQDTIDNYLTEEQCGFRQSRGTTDAVFVVRQIVEKAKERRIALHWNFVDFKAAFDTIWIDHLPCCWSGSLCASMTPRAMPAGDLSPGRATHAGQVKG